MISFKYSIAIFITIITIKILCAYAEPSARNSTRKIFKFIISDGVQDFAIEDWYKKEIDRFDADLWNLVYVFKLEFIKIVTLFLCK